ncbi:MAG: hypothetical protein ACXVB0_14840 [Mucilaginibacter sp.]
MGTIASPKDFYSYFKKGHFLSDLGKKIFSGNYYHGNTAYYKAVLSQYVNFTSYINIFNNTINLGSIHTEMDVQPDVLGAQAKDLVDRYGKPNFIFTEKDLAVFVYKWKFNGLKTRCEIHFYKNKAFLVNYIYNQLDKTEKDYIISTITRKYLSQYVNEVNLDSTKIVDNNNNVLFINDFLMGFKVTYLSNIESDWFEAMAGEVNTKRARIDAKIRFGEKSFFNRI